MRFFKRLGFQRLAWSLRRIYCPVPREALVLEVGSGGNPYARANVLMDAYECTRERHWEPLVSDRPTALGFVEQLPFKDKCFDFVIASHVLEHSTDPSLFLSELQRVAKAGYIEVPDAFFERLNPYLDHRLEITVKDNYLNIRKKKDWVQDQEIVDLYENRFKNLFSGRLIPRNPFDFHVRYYWQDRIEYVILNEDENISWQSPEVGEQSAVGSGSGMRRVINLAVLSLFRRLFSQKKRNKSLNIYDMLVCPDCKCQDLVKKEQEITCSGCGNVYDIKDSIPRMITQGKKGREQE